MSLKQEERRLRRKVYYLAMEVLLVACGGVLLMLGDSPAHGAAAFSFACWVHLWSRDESSS